MHSVINDIEGSSVTRRSRRHNRIVNRLELGAANVLMHRERGPEHHLAALADGGGVRGDQMRARLDILRLNVVVDVVRANRRRRPARVSSMCIIVKHMSQNIFGVLEPLRHLGVIRLERLVQWQRLPLALLVDVGDESALRVEEDLGVVLEAHLHDLVRQPEHDGVLRPHPLLDVNDRPLLWLAALVLHLDVAFDVG